MSSDRTMVNLTGTQHQGRKQPHNMTIQTNYSPPRQLPLSLFLYLPTPSKSLVQSCHVTRSVSEHHQTLVRHHQTQKVTTTWISRCINRSELLAQTVSAVGSDTKCIVMTLSSCQCIHLLAGTRKTCTFRSGTLPGQQNDHQAVPMSLIIGSSFMITKGFPVESARNELKQ
jgi:hypothetical protein